MDWHLVRILSNYLQTVIYLETIAFNFYDLLQMSNYLFFLYCRNMLHVSQSIIPDSHKIPQIENL